MQLSAKWIAGTLVGLLVPGSGAMIEYQVKAHYVGEQHRREVLQADHDDIQTLKAEILTMQTEMQQMEHTKRRRR